MTRLLTNRIATMTEMREPHKVLEEAGGNPVAVLKNSQCVGYFIPVEVVDKVEAKTVSRDRLTASLEKTRSGDKPVLDYLKDK